LKESVSKKSSGITVNVIFDWFYYVYNKICYYICFLGDEWRTRLYLYDQKITKSNQSVEFILY